MNINSNAKGTLHYNEQILATLLFYINKDPRNINANFYVILRKENKNNLDKTQLKSNYAHYTWQALYITAAIGGCRNSVFCLNHLF